MFLVDAIVIKQGEILSYLTAIAISDLLDLLDIPDPHHPFEDNRRVKLNHAREFGDYWENQTNGWIVPPLLLDTEENLKGEGSSDSGEEIFKLVLKEDRNKKLSILDGQHRVLGWFLKNLELERRHKDEINNYNKAVFENDMNGKLRAKEEIANIDYLRKRMKTEKVGILIVSGIGRQIHRQFFVDIAKNALGINKTVQAKFDVSSIVNRVSKSLMETHPLLVNRVDTENTKCSGDNENLLSVVNLTDIVRHIGFGINGRVSSKKELQYKDQDLYQISLQFFDLMLSNISILQQIEEASIRSRWVRENSLLGSGTIWRCLAGTFHNICVVDKEESSYGHNMHKLSVLTKYQKTFVNFIKEFEGESKLPISRGWLATGFFPKKTSSGPTSRSQDLLGLVRLFEAWIESGEFFVPKKLKEK